MTPEEWQRVRPVLESALELDPSSRSQFLDDACVDFAMRREVESLIASYERAGTKLSGSGPAINLDLGDEAHFRLLPGKRIGVYEIREEIAVGGMGAVYRAVRADGQYRQQVALKIVRPELGAELTASRFKNERQILASLDHPNIAKILDGATTADGIPYFVMELIEGLPITSYCDEHKLSIDARLHLFRTVCSAVHYAHQRLVIHRDIKPSNILVTAGGVPKLLDFGIAKILDPTLLPEIPAVTEMGMWVMTPEYASPEQFRGGTITTATDVYSLGLVLYELLTGHQAHRFTGLAPHEIARAVLESEPEKPSVAVRGTEEVTREGREKITLTPDLVSGLRSDTPEKLRRCLGGELDNILLKAIRKEPSERYASADQFSEDVRRYLEGLPVLARKSTLGYRCRKYVLRHKVGVGAAALILLSLVTGLVLTIREARIAQANAARAERRFNDVRMLAGSLIFEIHDSIRALPGATAARQLILQRAQQYLDNLAPEARTDAALLRELAAAYEKLAGVEGNVRDANLGNSAKALENERKGIELRKLTVALQPQNRDFRLELAQADSMLALFLNNASEKKATLQEALAILEPLAASSPDDPKVQYSLAKAYELSAPTFMTVTQGVDWDRGRGFYEKSMQIYERLAKTDPKNAGYQVEVSFAHKHLGSVLAMENKLQEALDHYRQALALDEAQLAAHSDDLNARYAITFTYSDTGYILGERGDVDAALSYYRKALDIRAAMVAADPRDTRARNGLGNTYNYIGGLLQQKGNYAGALESFKKSLSLREALAHDDPANQEMRFAPAKTRSSIGQLYVEMATNKDADPKKQADYCRASRPWLESALPVYLQLQKQGELRGNDAEDLSRTRKAQEQCDRLVAGRSVKVGKELAREPAAK